MSPSTEWWTLAGKTDERPPMAMINVNETEPRTMNTDQPTAPSRVRSRDGTEIAYWTSGQGPPLVVVHGALADHTRWLPLLPHLEPHSTVHALDRRGRGASGDSSDYALEREFEDVAAVVDAVAETSGDAVNVYGHSHGGIVAFGAATLTSNIRRLVLYEGWHVPDPDVYALPKGLDLRMDALLAAGDRDGVVELLFRELLHMSDEDVAAIKAAPSWSGRVAAAHTITRELREERTARLHPGLAGRITVPVLLVTGEKSADPSTTDVEHVAAALPTARILVLEGQGHVADVLDPQSFASHVVPFLVSEQCAWAPEPVKTPSTPPCGAG
jgi:pimeloyl-ACP methyl ester carboxylesterase